MDPRRRSPSSEAEAERRRERCGRGARPDHGTTSPRRLSIRAGPIPGIASSSSTDVNGPCSLPVVDDLLRRDGPDAGQRVELLDRRRVEVDGRRAAPARPRPAPARPAARARGTSTCSPSASGAARLTSADVGTPGRPAGAGDRVGDPRALRQPVDARDAGRRPATSTTDHAAVRRAARAGERSHAAAAPDRLARMRAARRRAGATAAQHERERTATRRRRARACRESVNVGIDPTPCPTKACDVSVSRTAPTTVHELVQQARRRHALERATSRRWTRATRTTRCDPAVGSTGQPHRATAARARRPSATRRS